MSADRIERVQDKAEIYLDNAEPPTSMMMAGIPPEYRRGFTEGAEFGADTFRTLTEAEWAETREDVARALMERADLVNLGAAGDWYAAGHTIKEDFRGHAEAAMRAAGLRREGE